MALASSQMTGYKNGKGGRRVVTCEDFTDDKKDSLEKGRKVEADKNG